MHPPAPSTTHPAPSPAGLFPREPSVPASGWGHFWGAGRERCLEPGLPHGDAPFGCRARVCSEAVPALLHQEPLLAGGWGLGLRSSRRSRGPANLAGAGLKALAAAVPRRLTPLAGGSCCPKLGSVSLSFNPVNRGAFSWALLICCNTGTPSFTLLCLLSRVPACAAQKASKIWRCKTKPRLTISILPALCRGQVMLPLGALDKAPGFVSSV